MLRAAFDGMSNDPSFRAAADTAKLDLSYMNGETLERLVNWIGLEHHTAVELAKKITQRGATAVELKSP